MKVLVLDASQRSALATTRSLGRRQVEVLVADSAPSPIAGVSRYASECMQYPDPCSDPRAFLSWVSATAVSKHLDVVLPMTDVTTMLLAPVAASFAPTRIGCAPETIYNQLSDKELLLDLARSVGIKTPQTAVLDDRDSFDAHIRHCRFPLVLKPARSKVLLADQVLSTSVFIASTPADAKAYIAEQEWFGKISCLAQEYVRGVGAGIFALYNQGSPIAWFAHQRLREKPPSGGVSVLCESVTPGDSLRSLSERLLTTAGCHGPAMVEYRISEQGEPYLMEVNCRFWGSLQLSIDCGLDFPWLWLQTLRNQHAQEAQPYVSGRRLRWLLGDVDNLLIQLRDANLSSRAKLVATTTFLKTFFDLSSAQEIFRWSDPRPALREFRNWLKAAL